jgi:hypothetical protein
MGFLVTMSASNKTLQSTRAIFYKLISAKNRESYREATVDDMIIHTEAFVLEVRDAIYEKNSPLFEWFDTTALQVYENESSFTRRKTDGGRRDPMRPGCRIGSYGLTAETPLIIVVSSAETRMRNTTEIYYLSLDDQVPNHEVSLYNDVAQRVRADAERKAFVDALWDQFPSMQSGFDRELVRLNWRFRSHRNSAHAFSSTW